MVVLARAVDVAVAVAAFYFAGAEAHGRAADGKVKVAGGSVADEAGFAVMADLGGHAVAAHHAAGAGCRCAADGGGAEDLHVRSQLGGSLGGNESWILALRSITPYSCFLLAHQGNVACGLYRGAGA